MKIGENLNKIKNNLMGGSVWKRRIIGTVSCLVVATGMVVIVRATVIQSNFNPAAFMESNDNYNDVNSDSVVFGANQNENNDYKEIDQKAKDDAQLKDGDENYNDTQADINNSLQIADASGNNSSDNNDNNSDNFGNNQSDLTINVTDDDKNAGVIVVPNPDGSGAGTGSGSGSGTGTNPDDGNGNKPETGGDGTGDNGGGTGGETETKWACTGISIECKDGTSNIIIYKYMNASPDTVKSRINVKATYVDENDSSNTMSTYLTTDQYDVIFPEGKEHTVTEADVGDVYDVTISYGGHTDSLNCETRNDYWGFERMDVTYFNSLNFYEGEPFGADAQNNVLSNIDMTVYVRSSAGRVSAAIYHYQNSEQYKDFTSIAFHTTNANMDDMYADVIIRDDIKLERTVVNAVKFNVYKHLVNVRYYDDSVLQQIYTDDSSVNMTSDYYGTCPYNTMIDRLKSEELLKTDADGNLLTMFYGWSLYQTNVDKNDVSTSFEITDDMHVVNLYPYKLEDVATGSDYIINVENGQQILVGYRGTDSVIDVPYGVTKVALNSSFKIDEAVAADISTIKIPATVNNLDLSAAGDKLPNLSTYSVDYYNGTYESGDNGVLYSKGKSTLLRVPSNAPDTVDISANVEIVEGYALQDAISGLAKKNSKLTVKLNSADAPQIFYIGRITDDNGDASFKVMVNDGTAEDEIQDYILMKYVSKLGTYFDNKSGKDGFALSKVFVTESDAQTKYNNTGNTVYSVDASGEKTLEYVAADAPEVYTVDSSYTAIGSYAFQSAINVETIYLANSITKLNDYAFATIDKNSILGINIKGNEKIEIGKNLIGEYSGNIALDPNKHIIITDEQEKNSNWSETLKKDYTSQQVDNLLIIGDYIVVNDSGAVYLKNIKDNTMILCGVSTSLTEYTAPAGVVAVKEGAFANCSKLKVVILPEVTEIGVDAFKECRALEIVALTSEKYVNVASTFEDCDMLQMVVAYNSSDLKVPNGVIVETDKNCFVNGGIVYRKNESKYSVVKAVTSLSGIVTLENNTVKIEDNAFENCKEFSGFTQSQWDLIDYIGNGAFVNCIRLTTEKVKTADFTEYQLRIKAKYVGDNAFDGCASIVNLYLDKGMDTLGNNVFNNLTALKNVYWYGDTKIVGDYMFKGCSAIDYLELGDENAEGGATAVTTSGNYTFQNCTTLTSWKLNRAFKNIGDYAFDGCSSLKTLTAIVDGVYCVSDIEKIGKYAFQGCEKLELSFIGANNVTEFGEGAFKDCAMYSTFVIPVTLKEIPDYCFAGCTKLRDIRLLGTSIERIGKAAFTGDTALTNIYNCDSVAELRGIDDYAFSSFEIDGTQYGACTSLIVFAFPNGMERIGKYAFAGDSLLGDINFSHARNITEIGEGAFENCSSVSAIDLSKIKATSLEKDTFKGCFNMSYIVTPETLSEIKDGVFNGCSKLLSITINNDNKKIEISKTAFGGDMPENLSVTVPTTDGGKLISAYESDTNWMNVIEGTVTFTEITKGTILSNGGLYTVNEDGTYTLVSVVTGYTGVFRIDVNTSAITQDAFEGASKISMIVIPNKIEELPDGVFKDCTNLEALIMNRVQKEGYRYTVPTINGSLFGPNNEGRNQYFRVFVQESVLSYYEGWADSPIYSFGENNFSFNDTETLYSNSEIDGVVVERTLLYVPRSFTGALSVYSGTMYIADGAAENCTGITDVTLATSVIRIGKRAFAGCTSMKTVFCANTTATKLNEIAEEAFEGCTSLVGKSSTKENQLTIPVSIRTIGKGAFKNCSSLTYISIQATTGASSITEIADETFMGCTSLATFTGSATMLASIERIGDRAFYGCEGVTSLSWTNMTNLKEVGISAYEGCPKLTLATFANKLEKIGDRAFYGSIMESISFNGITPPVLGKDIIESEKQDDLKIYVVSGGTGNSVVEAYKTAWADTYPKLADNVESFNVNAFRMVSNVLFSVNPLNAKELTAIYVSKNFPSITLYTSAALYCTGIADDAMNGCSNLKTVTMYAAINKVNTSYIQTIGNRAFKDCTSLSSVILNYSNDLKSIGNEAFANCKSLTTLYIPEAVTSLGDKMLSGATSFKTLTVNAPIPCTLGSHIFGDEVPKETEILVPADYVEVYRNRWGTQLDLEYGIGTSDIIKAQAK